MAERREGGNRGPLPNLYTVFLLNTSFPVALSNPASCDTDYYRQSNHPNKQNWDVYWIETDSITN